MELFVDSRFITRAVECRGDKIIWKDVDGNDVDYDFAFELGGTTASKGVPVGFVETFWRRGSRHSKDKARDDTGKLVPMRATYPTARYLGIVSGGDFTEPARDLVSSRGVHLFYVPKAKIVAAFKACGVVIDYADNLDEASKAEILKDAEVGFAPDNAKKSADKLCALVGQSSLNAFQLHVRSSISSLPQEIRIQESRHSEPAVFDAVAKATDFLDDPVFSNKPHATTYRYSITYSDGTDFSRDVDSLASLRVLHASIASLADHMERLSS